MEYIEEYINRFGFCFFFILWFYNSVFVNYLDVIPNCCYLKKKKLEGGRMKYYKQKNR